MTNSEHLFYTRNKLLHINNLRQYPIDQTVLDNLSIHGLLAGQSFTIKKKKYFRGRRGGSRKQRRIVTCVNLFKRPLENNTKKAVAFRSKRINRQNLINAHGHQEKTFNKLKWMTLQR